jgi:hypothetical protein
MWTAKMDPDDEGPLFALPSALANIARAEEAARRLLRDPLPSPTPDLLASPARAIKEEQEQDVKPVLDSHGTVKAEPAHTDDDISESS